ncbi:hypothetical protein UFOVP102_35 [uncultured Caudovirales phage]|uniref:Uncharacterized protein n=1 Tax=uncultured Caudovirales phage TaxID=2100421 RepID=A0A6J5L554_9CAUD|nr:hypothetical protein UFOVP102_35 [uncultured Caudovirales phage]
MSLVLDDRVRETTQTTGTGTITLDGAVQGFQSFAVIGNNNTTYYTINRGAEWEVGLGTYYGGTLSRDTVLASSTGSKVNFSAGSKDVFVTYPSEKSVYLNESGKTQFNGNSYQDINPISTPAFQEGRFWYDTDQHLLAFYNDVSSAVVHVGQDTQFRVINSTGSTIPNGSPVYITSSSSGSTSPYVALAKADVAATCAVIGLANGSIAAGATGYVTAQGVIDNVNTGTYTVGQVLYLSPYSAGQLMNTVPPTGIVVQVGTVSYVNSSTGKIFVKQTTPLSISGSTITGAISGVTIDNSIIGGTTPAAGTFSSLRLNGTSGNFTGDFSNATVLSRNSFKTSTVDSSTGIYALPNGSSTAASWQASNAADPTNASKILIATNGSTDVQLVSGINGSGSYLPLSILNGGAKQVEVASVPSAVNYLQLKGSVTTLVPSLSSQGTDSNISMAIQPKGTGAIDLAAGSSGVNISNGGTVTAITRTNSGSGYTSPPTVTVSAPTTAGGVQAQVTAFLSVGGATTLSSGGTGYTVGDVLTVSGGTFTSAATITVNTVSAGVIATFTVTTGGQYSVFPSNPASVTGGTGSSATFTLNGVVSSTYTITNAGSGYVEQPTVTFSSGSATAYATVGGTAFVKGIGATGIATIDFQTPQSITAGVPAMRIRDNVSDSYPMVNNTSASGNIVAQGNANANLGLASAGTGSVRLYTNGTSLTQQFLVSHTASAVNYVQVTGATTASKVVAISAQGSDADVTLSLAPKGAGTIRFGTYTAGVLTPTGYITITDSGGTSRRLLVG